MSRAVIEKRRKAMGPSLALSAWTILSASGVIFGSLSSFGNASGGR